MVDLIGENRIIAANGLRALQTTANIGLDKLMDMCEINRERLSSYHIGFVIGPCLNATGRLESAKKGDTEIATRVSVQLQLTDPAVKSRDRVVKKSEKVGLYTALDVGCVWLERALAGK